jgi:stage V sporulation protein G
VDFEIFDLKVENIEHEMGLLIDEYKNEQNAQKNYNFMEGIEMSNIENTKITARVTPIENGSNLKGSATITIGDQIAVHGVKVVQGEKGLFVSMPGEMGKNNKFYDTVLPKSKEASAVLTATVLAAYQDALTNGKQNKTDLEPTEMSVKVWSFRTIGATKLSVICLEGVNIWGILTRRKPTRFRIKSRKPLSTLLTSKSSFSTRMSI